MDFTAEIFTIKCTGGAAIRVIVDGDKARPWEFASRYSPRTPLQRRACELRAIAFVREKVAA